MEITTISESNPAVHYQGIEGSFSYAAARSLLRRGVLHRPTALSSAPLPFLLKGEPCLLGSRSFEEIIASVVAENHLGILPLENTLAGSIYTNYDLLEHSEVTILGEEILPVSHCIALSKDAVDCSAVTEIHSHPKALEQCVRFLAKYPHWKQVASASTADAAKMVATASSIHLAALASEEAAVLYNLQVIAHAVEDHPGNFTRFVLLGKGAPMQPFEGAKCSLTFRLPHRAGALHSFLEVLAQDGANLTKLESRPLIGAPFEYRFYLDFLPGKSLDRIVKTLEERAAYIRVLGWYLPFTE